MKLLGAVQLGSECGLGTVEECFNNVSFHSLSLFEYDKLGDELIDLEEDLSSYAKFFNISEDEVFNWNIKEFYFYHEEKKKKII